MEYVRYFLLSVIINNGTDRIYELNCDTDTASYFIDTSAITFEYRTQACWFSDSMDWAVFKDHEGFVFLCGNIFQTDEIYQRINH